MDQVRSVDERRATVARLSLLVGLMWSTLFAALLVPHLATAASAGPVLNSTVPSSPNTSLTPGIKGVAAPGVEIHSVRGLRTDAIGFATEGEVEILIFENGTCAGAATVKSTAAQLESETGIPVEVAPESTTTFSALRVEGAEVSLCSNAIEYQQVRELPPPPAEEPVSSPPPPSGSGSGSTGNGGTTAPPEPPHLHLVPGIYGNDLTPLVAGSALGAAGVEIFSGSGCGGTPVAKGSPAQLSAGFPVPVQSNAVNTFYGLSIGPTGARSHCSSAVSYTEDSLPPHVRITMAPAGKTRKRKAVFRFTDTTGDAPGTTFFCQVDGKKWKVCTSPLKLKKLKRRRYTVKVKATDPAGNAEPKPAKRSFKVV